MIKKIGIAVVVLARRSAHLRRDPARHVRIQARASIRRRPERIFAVLNDFLRWESWSPWRRKPRDEKDLQRRNQRQGRRVRVGGNKDVGQGSMRSRSPCRHRRSRSAGLRQAVRNAQHRRIHARTPGRLDELHWVMQGPCSIFRRSLPYSSAWTHGGKDFEPPLPT